jgi:hypothetical protein
MSFLRKSSLMQHPQPTPQNSQPTPPKEEWSLSYASLMSAWGLTSQSQEETLPKLTPSQEKKNQAKSSKHKKQILLLKGQRKIEDYFSPIPK